MLQMFRVEFLFVKFVDLTSSEIFEKFIQTFSKTSIFLNLIFDFRNRQNRFIQNCILEMRF